MSRILSAAMAIAVISTSSLAQAQTVRRPVSAPLATIQAACTRQFGDAVMCGRIAEQSRMRYGETVTHRQWQSAAGVVRAKLAQGKY